MKRTDLRDPLFQALVAIGSLFVLMLLVPMMAHAQANGTATLSCTAPTTNTDGSPIKAPVTIKFFWGVTQGTYPNSSPAQSSCAYVVTGLAPANWFFVATAIDGNGTSSAYSTVATKTILPTPNPPTNLTVTGATTAYSPFKSGGLNRVAAVGNVAPGTACDATNGVVVGGVVYNTVPISAVTFANPVAKAGATAIVAQCG